VDIDTKTQRSFIVRWANMLDRCDNPENKMYHRYGGRGISVCPQWRDFYRFMKDLPEGFFVGAEIDRIDNDGNYEPSNIRWSTRLENSRNRCTARIIEFDGKSMCATEWADAIGINISSLMERLDKWSLIDALTKPKATRIYNRWDGHKKPEKKPKKITALYDYLGKKYSMTELSRLSCVSAKLLRKRINERGWDVARAVQTPVEN